MIDVDGIVETNHYESDDDDVVVVVGGGGGVVGVVDQSFHYLKKR